MRRIITYQHWQLTTPLYYNRSAVSIVEKYTDFFELATFQWIPSVFYDFYKKKILDETDIEKKNPKAEDLSMI